MPPLFPALTSQPQRILRFLAAVVLISAVFLASHHAVAAAIALAAVLATFGLQRAFRSSTAAVAAPMSSAITPAAPAEEDRLTGIANLDALAARLEQEWTRERRPAEPTALLLIAVDAFPALQAEGGQLASDIALLTLARALTRQLPRRADLLARYNASTFAVVLPGTDLPGTLRVAARLRWSIVRLGVAHPRSSSGFVTACTGIAVQHGLLGNDSQALLTAAEGALRTAQSSGPDHLEYVVLQGEDRSPFPAPPVLAMAAVRAWATDREKLRPSQG